MNDHMDMQSGLRVPEGDLTCRDVAAFLMAYVDGELEAGARRGFDEHLAQCSSCVRYVEHYRRTVAMAQAVGREAEQTPVPAGVLRAIRAARAHVA